MKTKGYLLATNDKDGSTIVVVPYSECKWIWDAAVVANRYFKTKKESLHIRAGFRKGNKVSELDDLNTKANCWMVWR